eukprot:UN24053
MNDTTHNMEVADKKANHIGFFDCFVSRNAENEALIFCMLL